jgi:Uma2 family endonuclease
MTAKLNNFYFYSEEYLENERISLVKHEYIRGEIYVMAETSKAHGIVSLNLAALLRNHLRGSGCTTYMADIKVWIEIADAYYYPDITVTCNPQDNIA